ncbi:phosphotransferase [Brevibacillus daliensis]|uniref:phosphotransferase n=1 Tax=Brevibacillus daliensis TaxID=2892995 RepID=UPI001E53D5C7|nr:phosphotransferase [Brevibacillus daliensis]
MDSYTITALENAFRCKIHSVKPLRSVYSIKTDRGDWIVKEYRNEEKALWVTNLSDILLDQGFFQTVQYVGNRSHHWVEPIGNRFFTVMKTIHGREATYSSKSDIKKSVATLAKFHRAAEGFPPDPTTVNNEGRPPLLEKWERRLDQFQKISKKISVKGPQNRLETIISNLSKEIKRDGYEVMQLVHHMPIQEQMQHAIDLGTLAHRDVASHNFLIKESGSCYLIDLDTVAPDMQLVDLVQILHRLLFLHGYSRRVYYDTIEAYQKIKPLSDQEIQMVFQLLRYPDNALREITGIYGKQPGYRVNGVTQLLQMEQQWKKARRKFLNQYS